MIGEGDFCAQFFFGFGEEAEQKARHQEEAAAHDNPRWFDRGEQQMAQPGRAVGHQPRLTKQQRRADLRGRHGLHESPAEGGRDHGEQKEDEEHAVRRIGEQAQQ